MKGLIISSGDFNNYELLAHMVKDKDYILCADGGLRHIMSINKCPDAIIGDFDSIDSKAESYIRVNNIPMYKFPIEKDETDTELAIMQLIKIGCDDITLVGGTGTRMDHSLANIYLLKRLNDEGIKAKIVDDHNTIYFCNDSLELLRNDNKYVSVIPITLNGVIVTLNGFYYPLLDATIKFGSTLGVSNKIIEKTGIIRITSGEALIIESKD